MESAKQTRQRVTRFTDWSKQTWGRLPWKSRLALFVAYAGMVFMAVVADHIDQSFSELSTVDFSIIAAPWWYGCIFAVLFARRLGCGFLLLYAPFVIVSSWIVGRIAEALMLAMDVLS